MFDADRPITKSSEDRLDRVDFAKSLARSLLDDKHSESIVVGLYGGVGSGKTSLINLVIEELNIASEHSIDEEKPIIINMSVWSYAGRKRLMQGFYHRLISAIENAPALHHKNKIIYLLQSYLSFFTDKPAYKKLSWFERLWKKKPYAYELGEDITDIKADINYFLAKQKHKIIITIDNISTLSADEIQELFQLIKSMANFINTGYLLALEKKQVLHAINRMTNDAGERFLEKIIQIPFHIPSIFQHDLETLLAEKLQPLMKKVPEDKWQQHYFAELYDAGLKYLFKDARDVARYVNLLHFSYPRIRETVNPVDFFALTALEVFMPSVYSDIHENKDLFSDLLDHVYPLTTEQIAIEKKRVDEIIHQSHSLPHDSLLTLLILIFPRLQKIYYSDRLTYHSQAMLDKLQRVCSPQYFDAYFRLSLRSPVFTHTQCRMILDTANNALQLDQALNRLNQDTRILTFLEKIDNSRLLDTLPINNIQHIISVLLDNGDLFQHSNKKLLALDTPSRIHHIIHLLLQRIEKKEERFLILQQAIVQAKKSIYIIVYEVQQQLLAHDESSDDYQPDLYCDLNENMLPPLKTIAAAKIMEWANNNSLNEHPQLLALLTAWLKWDNAENCQRYIEKLTQDDRGLLDFLSAIFKHDINQTMAYYVKDKHGPADIEKMRAFIAPEDCISPAVKLFESQSFESLSEHDQLAILIFLDLMDVKTKKRFPKVAN